MNQLSKKLLSKKGYYDAISDLIESSVVLKMDEYIQHGTTSTLDHCIRVSYRSYKIAKLFKMDYKSAARAGLLHDLFLYDWHLEPKRKLFEKHGYTHPKTALMNASNNFNLNSKEKDIILKHMWPLTLRSVPKYKESFLVSIVDKYSSCGETLVPFANKLAEFIF